MINFIVGPYIM